MTFFEKIFGKKEKSASKAKVRLKEILARERPSCAMPYINDLKEDLMTTINKYTKVDDIKIKAENNHNIDVLEVEIILDK